MFACYNYHFNNTTYQSLENPTHQVVFGYQRDMHCCGTSRREGSNVSNPERRRTKSLASKQLTVDAPRNLPPLWSGKFGKKLCRYLQDCYIVYKMVGMGIWFIAATPWHRHKEIKSDLVKQKCPKTPQNHSPLEWVWVSKCSAGTRFSSGHCRKTFITWKKNTFNSQGESGYESMNQSWPPKAISRQTPSVLVGGF